MNVPYSIDAERAVLSGIMVENNSLYSCIDLIRPADFYQHSHQILYAALHSMIGNDVGVDQITLKEWLVNKGSLDAVGGLSYLIQLIDGQAQGKHVGHYAKIVADHARKRRLLAAVHNALADDKPTETILEELERATDAARAQQMLNTANAEAMAPLQMDYWEELQKHSGMTGLRTGLTRLDNLLRGLQPEEMTTLAGMPGTGKTAMLTTLIRNMPEVKIGMWSLEQRRSMILNRIACAITDLDLVRLRDGTLDSHEWKGVNSAMIELAKRKEGLWICDTPGVTLEQILSETRRRKEKYGLDLLMIDYFTLIRHSLDRKNHRTDEIYKDASNRLKELARKLRIHVIVVCQVKAEVRKYDEPDVFSLGETRQLAYDADNELYLYQREGKIIGEDEDMIKLAKQRNGPIARFAVRFYRHSTAYENLKQEGA